MGSVGNEVVRRGSQACDNQAFGDKQATIKLFSGGEILF